MPEIKLGLSVRPDHNSCIHSYSMSELRGGNKQKRTGKKCVYVCILSICSERHCIRDGPKTGDELFFFFLKYNLVI